MLDEKPLRLDTSIQRLVDLYLGGSVRSGPRGRITHLPDLESGFVRGSLSRLENPKLSCETDLDLQCPVQCYGVRTISRDLS